MHADIAPVRSMSARKTHLANGVLIGMGVMIVLLAFWGWFTDNYLFNTLSSVLEQCGIGINRHFIFNDLNRLMYTHVFFIAIGFVSLLAGVISETFYRRKHPK